MKKLLEEMNIFLLSLDLKLKDEGIVKWTAYKEIEALSNLFNATKNKILSNTDLTMVVKLPNSISFENRISKLMNEWNIYVTFEIFVWYLNLDFGSRPQIQYTLFL